MKLDLMGMMKNVFIFEVLCMLCFGMLFIWFEILRSVDVSVEGWLVMMVVLWLVVYLW